MRKGKGGKKKQKAGKERKQLLRIESKGSQGGLPPSPEKKVKDSKGLKDSPFMVRGQVVF